MCIDEDYGQGQRDYTRYRAFEIDRNLQQLGFHPLDVMITGVTGAGKSTTLNAFFQKKIASVGRGVDPETMELSSYSLGSHMRLWDTPGLGDGVEKDRIHKQKMIALLEKTYGDFSQYKFIDMALVIVEGCNRDMGTTYTLLNEVIVPHIQPDRILVAINQADVALKNTHWNHVTKQPDSQLISFLNEQANSIQRRVKEATGLTIHRPVYYSAEYGYNVDKLFDFIIDHMPRERRLS